MHENLKEKRKQTILKMTTEPTYKPSKIKELATILQVPPHDRKMFDEIMEELVREGKLLKNKRGKFIVPSTINLISGTFQGHAKGFGFLIMEDEPEDLFIPAQSVNGAMHKDKVMCKIVKAKSGERRAEAEVVEVLERNSGNLVGIYEQGKSFGFVVLDEQKYSKDIFISKKHSKGAVSGHKVLVKITNSGTENKNPEGEVIEILGHSNDPGVDILSVVYQYDLPTVFPNAVMQEVMGVYDEVLDKDKKGRTDLRGIPMVTIDGEDAKDLDDAVSLEILDNGLYRLGVHIADVTHYVKEGSELDKEALERGTSVYLVDRVIPMLPHKLSNGICSLNAGVDRLALTCMMDIDSSGNVQSHQIMETTINVDERMSYTQVKQILMDHDEELRERYKEFVPMFEEMEKLASILRKKRERRGAIDFNFPETKIILDKEGKPVELKPYDRNVATRLIEEFMLVCNETVAEDYFWQEKPFLYRSHENPDPEKVSSLTQLIKNFGYEVKVNTQKTHPKDMQKILSDMEDKPENTIISQLLLRSMKQARYTDDCLGHFGLAAKYYSHFTSPIRRYPDLQIHRIIKYNLHGKLKGSKEKKLGDRMPTVAKLTSVKERRAEEAERETIKMKKVEFMEDKVGRIFTGTISGITSWGIYVELPNTIEGLVHVSEMNDDYYVFDEANYRFVGERTHKIYQLGDTVEVKLIKADKALRTIDFRIKL
ncbi:MAG: ribonuclease R [Epulopiscium sp. Nele67-Bin005]|nr:MAG: ribonuclease R [Epulopiscium sp. Nele67-Bin005]